MFFEHTDKVLLAMEALEKRKFGYMKSEPKAALNSLGIRTLEKRNSNPYFGVYLGNSIIRDYKYDEENRIHFVVFQNDHSLELALNEAMIISKVDLGHVIFGINGIDFDINCESTFIDILDKTEMNLSEKIESTKEIAELKKTVYNKKGKQKELCYVLRQVADKKR